VYGYDDMMIFNLQNSAFLRQFTITNTFTKFPFPSIEFLARTGRPQNRAGVISRESLRKHRSHCWKAAGTYGNGVSVVKMFNKAKMHYILQDFAITISRFFWGWYPGFPQKCMPHALWNQTPIFACLASDSSCFTKRPPLAESLTKFLREGRTHDLAAIVTSTQVKTTIKPWLQKYEMSNNMTNCVAPFWVTICPAWN